MPDATPVDSIWALSVGAALFPAWGLALAHNMGSPPLTVRFFGMVFRRGGGYGLLALPVVSTSCGYAYLQLVMDMTARARASATDQAAEP